MFNFQASTAAFCVFFIAELSSASAQETQVETVIQTGHSGEIQEVQFSPDGKFIVTASADNTARLWDVSTGKEVRAFVGHTSYVNDVEFDVTGRFIVTGSADRTAKLWDLATGKEIRSLGKEREAYSTWHSWSSWGHRKGHMSEITRISISPNGRYLATGSNDDFDLIISELKKDSVDAAKLVNSIIIWDLQEGEPKKIINVTEIKEKEEKKKIKSDTVTAVSKIKNKDGKKMINSKTVTAISFSPDSKHLIVGVTDKAVEIYKVKSGKLVKKFAIEDLGLSLKDIFSKNVFKNIKSAAKEKLDILLSSSTVFSTDISPDGKYIVSGHSDGTVRLWKIKKGNAIWKLPAKFPIWILRQIPVIKLLVGQLDNEARIFKGHEGLIYSVSFSPDGKYIVTGCTSPYSGEGNRADNTARIWEVATGKQLRIFKGHTQGVTSARFSPDGKYVVTGSLDYTAKLWDASTGQEIRTFAGHSYRVNTALFSPNNQYVAISASNQSAGGVRFWDLTSGRQTHKLSGHAGSITMAKFSPSGERLVTSGEDRIVKIWASKTGNELYTLKNPDYIQDDEQVPKWMKKSLTTLIKFEKISLKKRVFPSVTAIDFSPTGQMVVTCAADNQIKLWEVETGNEIKTIGKVGYRIHSLKFSPDAKTIITGSDTSSHPALWDINTGKVLKKYGGGLFSKRHSDEVLSISFSPDGQKLVTGSADLTAMLWEVKTGKALARFTGHIDCVQATGFSPDGRVIATGSWDNTVKLWNAVKDEKEKYQELRTLTGHSKAVLSVDFSRNDKYLLTGSLDGTAKLWDPATGKELASFIAIDSLDYIVLTPDYYYMGSKNAHKGIAFRLVNKVFPFEQFDLKRNRPDIVLERMGSGDAQLIAAYRQAYQKRLKRMSFTEAMLGSDLHLPEIAVTRDSLQIMTTEKTIRFRVSAKDSKYLLDRLNVFVNDVPIYGIQGINLRPLKVDSVAQEISLELSYGKNKIQVSALNEKGVESLKETFEITYRGEIAKPDLYLVMIGVSEYADRAYNLKYAAKDAEDLAGSLGEQAGRFNQIHAFKLLNQNATKEKIFALKDTLMRSQVDDEVILFVAGHGMLDDRLDYYFATTDINFEKPSEGGLLYEEIEGLLDGIPARKKLLLMDTCHSGEVDKEETVLVAAKDTTANAVKSRSFRNIKPVAQTNKLGLSNSFQMMQELFANLSRGSGAMVISAASGVEFAYEDQKWQNGVFTYSLLDGLKTKQADLNNDGELRVSELRDYVAEKVRKLTNGKQTPTSRRENLEFDFRVF